MQNTNSESISFSDLLTKSRDSGDSHFSNLTLSELNYLDIKLKNLCLNFDPFNPHNLKDYALTIDGLGLSEALKNPFEFSNKLLRMLDQIEAGLKMRSH
jgi:hypothetical protein